MTELIGIVLGIGSIAGIVILAVILRAYDTGDYSPSESSKDTTTVYLKDQYRFEWPDCESEQEAWSNTVDNQELWG